MKKSTDLFDKQPVWKLIAGMSLPAVVTIVVMLIYNMADMFFVGLQHDDIQVASISLTGPLYQLLMAGGTLIGAGACAAIAKALGERKEAEVKKLSAMAAVLCVLIGVLFAAVVLSFLDPILVLIGVPEAETALFGHARRYVIFLAAGAPFIIFSCSFANIVRAEGAIKESMIGNMIGTLVNLVLDPVFILAFRMGVAGAAIATVLGNACSCIYFVRYFKKHPTALSIRPEKGSLHPRYALAVLTLGFPSAVTNLLASFAHTIYNRTMIQYGTEAVTAMGAASRVAMIISMIAIGITQGIQPALGYNYGAGNVRRTGEILLKSAVTTIVSGGLLTLLCFLFRHQIVTLFVHEQATVTLAEKMAAIALISCPVLGIYSLATSFLQACGNALSATILSLLRQGLFYVPLIFLLNRLFGLDGLLYAGVTADFLAIAVGIFLMLKQFHAFCTRFGSPCCKKIPVSA